MCNYDSTTKYNCMAFILKATIFVLSGQVRNVSHIATNSKKFSDGKFINERLVELRFSMHVVLLFLQFFY